MKEAWRHWYLVVIVVVISHCKWWALSVTELLWATCHLREVLRYEITHDDLKYCISFHVDSIG